MAKKQNKYVNIEFPSYELPTNVDELIAWINAKVAEQPVPRDKIDIEIESGYEYGDSYVFLGMSYSRPETTQEQAQREEREAIAHDAERKRYLALKAKFGD
jgi:hypothetical protein